ncbi:MAG: proline--tRNA ligase [Nitrospinota bacterium]|nr:proline--tRNA ligase [Nitrospinota bacterium]
MKISRYFAPTVREVPADAEIPSHRLMIRAGLIRKLAAGVYSLLPVGLRTLKKMENIIREELTAAGAIETLLPSLIPSDLWKETGRWDFYGKELLRIKDRHDNEFCYGPTHEEVMTDLVRREVRSYKQLPLNLFQIQTKFRDEIRPRFGVMRAREFLMKDGYSFDIDEGSAAVSYQKMYDAYSAVFRRAGLKFRVVEADTGQIGGSDSHEFMVLANSGEDLIVSCPKCGYASNVERTEISDTPPGNESAEKEGALTEVETPGQRTIEEVSAFLKRSPKEFIKTLVYSVNGGEELCAVLVRGDFDINEIKLKKLIKANEIELADSEKVKTLAGASTGFVGPQGLKCKIIADNSVKVIRNGISGANRDDYHVINVNHGRDFKPDIFGDIRMVIEGDSCPRCKEAKLDFYRGIEVGHIFRLGTKYSEAMKATYLDKDGKEQIIVMGTYGIGVGRTVAASIEQNHDDNGIIWPYAIAPFHISLLPLDVRKEEIVKTADDMEEMLEKEGFEILHDDRDERAGVKFKDADLLGIPIQLIIGEKGLKNGEVELKIRKTGERLNIKKEDVLQKLKDLSSSLQS